MRAEPFISGSATPDRRSGWPGEVVEELSSVLNDLLADVLALFVKTKNFHWHVSGPHFRDYHLLLDGQASQLLETVDPIAERVRKIGGSAVRSIGEVARRQRVRDNDATDVTAIQMLTELLDDQQALAAHLRDAHAHCDRHGDVATASLLENWIDEAEERAWFLSQAVRT